jgi:hypothetical protein
VISVHRPTVLSFKVVLVYSNYVMPLLLITLQTSQFQYQISNALTFKKETYLFYVRTQCVPRCKHSPPRLYKTNLLMWCKAKVAVCSETYTKHIKAM